MPDSEPSGITLTRSVPILLQTKRGGVASLIAGVLAVLGAAVLIVNILSGIPAIVGLGLGIISVTGAGARTGPAIAGTVFSSVALAISTMTTVILWNYQCCQI